MTSETTKIITTSSSSSSLYSFLYREKKVPVTFATCDVLSEEQCHAVLHSSPFVGWYRKCERSIRRKHQPNNNSNKNNGSQFDFPVSESENDSQVIDIRAVTIQSVDFFGARYVNLQKQIRWKGKERKGMEWKCLLYTIVFKRWCFIGAVCFLCFSFLAFHVSFA
jgi:hypothetical protein